MVVWDVWVDERSGKGAVSIVGKWVESRDRWMDENSWKKKINCRWMSGRDGCLDERGRNVDDQPWIDGWRGWMSG